VSGNASFNKVGGYNLTLTASNLTLSGADAGNYTLANTPVSVKGSITPAPYSSSPAVPPEVVTGPQIMAAVAQQPGLGLSAVLNGVEAGYGTDSKQKQGRVVVADDAQLALVSIVDGGIRLP
jgi:hypothetical protein